MRIAVVGAGGVGGYFGGRLAAAGVDVAFVARGPHLNAIQERGLRVDSVKGDFTVSVTAYEDPADIGPCEFVLYCVKSYDTDSAAMGLRPLIGPNTAVVSLQNGIDNEARLAAIIGAEHVVGGAAFIFASIVEPGVVAHTGGPARLVFGELDGSRTPRIEQLLAACRRGGVDADVPADVRLTLWTKFAFICATAGMTSAVRLPLGDIRDCEESWLMFRRIVAEVAELASVEGVALEGNVVEQQIGFAAALPPESYSSLYNDLVSGRRMELEALHGTVVRKARHHGLPVPANEAVYSVLRPLALRNERGAA